MSIDLADPVGEGGAPAVVVAIEDGGTRCQTHGAKVAADIRRDDVLREMLALSWRQALDQLGEAGVHQRVSFSDAKVERPPVGRTEPTNRIGAHDAPARLGAV